MYSARHAISLSACLAQSDVGMTLFSCRESMHLAKASRCCSPRDRTPPQSARWSKPRPVVRALPLPAPRSSSRPSLTRLSTSAISSSVGTGLLPCLAAPADAPLLLLLLYRAVSAGVQAGAHNIAAHALLHATWMRWQSSVRTTYVAALPKPS